MASSNVRLKLLIDTKARKVLFAEAGKDFVDFLFYLLSLPVGTVVKLLRYRSMVGCLTNLYGSIENLDGTYVQTNQSKDSVLNPKSSLLNICQMPLLQSSQEFNTRKFYVCPRISRRNDDGLIHLYATDITNLVCPACKAIMSTELAYVSPAASFNGTEAECGFVKPVVVATGRCKLSRKNNMNKKLRASSGNSSPAPAKKQTTLVERGFVKEEVTYMVMDNLEVMPMNAFSCTSLLNKFNIKDVGALEEKVVDFGFDEALKMLKASMECKDALTSVLFGN